MLAQTTACLGTLMEEEFEYTKRVSISKARIILLTNQMRISKWNEHIMLIYDYGDAALWFYWNSVYF